MELPQSEGSSEADKEETSHPIQQEEQLVAGLEAAQKAETDYKMESPQSEGSSEADKDETSHPIQQEEQLVAGLEAAQKAETDYKMESPQSEGSSEADKDKTSHPIQQEEQLVARLEAAQKAENDFKMESPQSEGSSEADKDETSHPILQEEQLVARLEAAQKAETDYKMESPQSEGSSEADKDETSHPIQQEEQLVVESGAVEIVIEELQQQEEEEDPDYELMLPLQGAKEQLDTAMISTKTRTLRTLQLNETTANALHCLQDYMSSELEDSMDEDYNDDCTRESSYSEDSKEDKALPKRRRKTKKAVRPQVVSDSDTDQNTPTDKAPPKKRNKTKEAVRPEVLSDRDTDQNTPTVVETENYPDEKSISRSVSNRQIYVSLVMKSYTTKKGKPKKGRVYNSHHFCFYCKRPFTNLAQHQQRRHSGRKAVKEIMSLVPQKSDSEEVMQEKDGKRKKLLAILRFKGDHEHNMVVQSAGHGEIILGRRFLQTDEPLEFNLGHYGPCPVCLQWLKLSVIDRHQCPVGGPKDTKGALLTQSKVLAGRISPKASNDLISKVFPIMKEDEVGIAAKEDGLILLIGNQWMATLVGNELMRPYYTSQVMRLTARLLLQLRSTAKVEHTTDDEENCLADYLRPQHFDLLAQAALGIAAEDMDDLEQLKSPSNCIKIGYEIKRMIDAKLGLAIRSRNEDEKAECRDLKTLMTAEWGFRVTKKARVTLADKRMNIMKKLPEPADLAKLKKYLGDKLRNLNLLDMSYSNFRMVAMVVQAKLLSYNRRRSGEIQAVRLTQYINRKKGVTDVDREMTRELTPFEQNLLDSQEVLEVRGKTGRTVPVIIPKETHQAMEFLSSSVVREYAKVQANKYLFATQKGPSVIRAYDSLTWVCKEAGLSKPERITSVSLRKYMATVTQCLDMSPAELNWALSHLGHTMNVHLQHYRARSDVIERVEIAKILLIQDAGLVHHFVGKKLDEIQFSDIVNNSIQGQANMTNAAEVEHVEAEPENSDQEEPSAALTEEDDIYRLIPDDEEFADRELEGVLADDVIQVKKKRARITPKNPAPRHQWTRKEEEELRKIFRNFFKEGKCPSIMECQKAQKISRQKNGFIHSLKPGNIRKKVWNMQQKEN